MYLTIISAFWVYYDHGIPGNVKFIPNFRLSLAQVNWNFVDRFLDLQQGPCSSRQRAIWSSAKTISYQGPFLLKQITDNSNSFMDK